jgi:hypothetical protein
LVADQIGTYASYIDANRTQYGSEKIKERVGLMNSNSFIAQWVPAVDSIGAENSFFKINQAPTPVDPIEKRILRSRNSAVAIATRAINRGGTGHEYWKHFDTAKQAEIISAGKAIYEALYSPPMGGQTIKSSDVPVGGRGYSSLPFIFDLVSLVNNIGPKDPLPKDEDGNQTLRFLREVRARIEYITTTEPQSLGLHPLIFFYTRGGAFQPVAFLATIQVIKRLVDRNKLNQFTKIRRELENFVIAHKEAFTLVVKRQGAGHRSRPALESFLEIAIDRLINGKSDAEIIAEMASDSRFNFFAVPAPIRGDQDAPRHFSRGIKSAAFVSELSQNGVRCGICKGLLHRNSIHTDHITRRADGGGAHVANAQLSHPYCNTGFKA